MTTKPGRVLLPGDPAVAVEPAVAPARQRPACGDGGWRTASVHTRCLAPTVIVIGAILVYPIYFLVRLSFEKYGLEELIAHQGRWIGVDNYTTIFNDSEFWRVLLRTVVFTAVTVGLTMVLGTLIAPSAHTPGLVHALPACNRARPRLGDAGSRCGAGLVPGWSTSSSAF